MLKLALLTVGGLALLVGSALIAWELVVQDLDIWRDDDGRISVKWKPREPMDPRSLS